MKVALALLLALVPAAGAAGPCCRNFPQGRDCPQGYGDIGGTHTDFMSFPAVSYTICCEQAADGTFPVTIISSDGSTCEGSDPSPGQAGPILEPFEGVDTDDVDDDEDDVVDDDDEDDDPDVCCHNYPQGRECPGEYGNIEGMSSTDSTGASFTVCCKQAADGTIPVKVFNDKNPTCEGSDTAPSTASPGAGGGSGVADPILGDSPDKSSEVDCDALLAQFPDCRDNSCVTNCGDEPATCGGCSLACSNGDRTICQASSTSSGSSATTTEVVEEECSGNGCPSSAAPKGCVKAVSAVVAGAVFMVL